MGLENTAFQYFVKKQCFLSDRSQWNMEIKVVYSLKIIILSAENVFFWLKKGFFPLKIVFSTENEFISTENGVLFHWIWVISTENRLFPLKIDFFHWQWIFSTDNRLFPMTMYYFYCKWIISNENGFFPLKMDFSIENGFFHWNWFYSTKNGSFSTEFFFFTENGFFRWKWIFSLKWIFSTESAATLLQLFHNSEQLCCNSS